MNLLPTILTTTKMGTTALNVAGVTSLLGTGASIFGTLSEASALRNQAKQAELQGVSEETQAMEKANALREEFLKNLSSSQAAFGAQGTSMSTGDPFNAAIESTKNIEKTTRKVDLQGQINKGQLMNQATQYRKSANSAILTGGMKAAKTLLTNGSTDYNKG